MTASGWIVVRDARSRRYYTVLAGGETWSTNAELAYVFADQRVAERVADRVGGRVESIGGGVPPSAVREPPPGGVPDMNGRLDEIVQHLRAAGASEAGPLSTGERAYVALAAGRYELLPRAYPDPIEAWHRLAPDWRRRVCLWRDWPVEWGDD